MKINRSIVGFSLVLLGLCPAFGQSPPPNDNFTNRTVLTGTDIVFSGSLAGATIETAREATNYNQYFSGMPATESVWWQWTASVTTTLTLQVLGSSTDQDRSSAPNSHALAIYYVTNGSSSPDGLVLPPLAFQLIDFQLAPITLSIPVIAGSNYQIQLIGNTSDNYNLRLIATNNPVIIQQSQSRTVWSNASTLFYVIAAGVPQSAFTFQWYFNGTNLSGETAPMLALTNIDGRRAGDYSVVVGNSSGGTTSQVATLSVSQSNVPISLSVIGMTSNSLAFSLAGESGGMYRIQSTTNMVNWSPEQSFPINPYYLNSTSIIFASNALVALTVSNNASRKFFRVTPYVLDQPDADVCVTHLAEIRMAKILWARDNNAAAISMPTTPDLTPYFPRHVAPVCPDDPNQTFDTSYAINNLMDYPVCLIHSTTHLLEQPQ